MKNYFYFLFFILCFGISHVTHAQTEPSKVSVASTYDITDLSIYPNPVSNDKIFITTQLNSKKEIKIYDVLGKNVLSTLLLGKELNVSKLPPGVYILKINEGNQSATRKLVVR